VDFGMDCALYVSDWVEGWNKPNKGRLYRVVDPALARDPAVREVKKLMAEGMAHRPLAELARLLEHKDMRVRQEAQFALADKGSDAIPALAAAAREGKTLVARLHGIWGLGQVGRKDPAAFKTVLALTSDPDKEVRAQAAKTLGDGKVAEAAVRLVALLEDPEPRVRFFAAQGLARLGAKGEVAPVLALLRANNDKDAYLRHAGVMVLAASPDRAAVLAAADDPSPAVRRAVLLALRRLASPEVARFLKDADASLVLEAARAINDLPIDSALPQLAALIGRPGPSAPLAYRVLNANFRLGKAENAAAVAAFAARADVPEALRVEALRELGDWAKPSGRDRVMGLWRPLPPRAANLAPDALRPALGGIFSGPDRVRKEAAAVAARLGIKEIGPALFDLVADTHRPAPVRVETLRALETLRDTRLEKAMQLALHDADPRVRDEGRRVLARLRPAEGLAALARALDDGKVVERQGAFRTLGAMKGREVDALLARSLDRLLAGKVAPEAHLDLLEAAARHPAAKIKEKLARYEALRPKDDPLGKYRETLVGGDADAGRRIFFQKAEVSCVRCHKVKGEGGEVGPDLTGIGTRQKRDYLAESIIAPNRQIAKGYETVVLTLKNGQTRTGVLKGEDAKEVRLMTGEGQVLVVPKSQIDERETGKSAMPEDLIKYLSPAEVRDLVEFLAEQK
jgi:quinoprotein glucose dehydrogenase